MHSGHLADAPIWDDVRTLTAWDIPGSRPVDIIAAGFPCPDVSDLGTGRGLEGEQSRLFFEVVRLAQETRATYVLLENVADILHRGVERVVQALHQAGYDCRWMCVAAADVGAPHERRRWFCLARRRAARYSDEPDEADATDVPDDDDAGRQPPDEREDGRGERRGSGGEL